MFRKTTLLAAALFCLLLCACTSAPAEPTLSTEAEGAASSPILTPPVVEAPPVETPPASSIPDTPPVCEHPNTVSGTGLAPTCTTGGENILLCADCKQEIAASQTPPLGHDYQQTAVVEAACATAGSRTLTCSRCGDTKTEELPAAGHKWNEATCTTPATCAVCNTAAAEPAAHSWVVKYAMGTPECKWCGTKYTFPDLTIVQNTLDIPFLVGSKSITLFDFNLRLSAFEGPFTPDSPCRVDITVDGVASNACTMTRSTHLLTADGTKITSIYDNHGTTNPICDGSFTETFSFDLPASAGTYTFVFSAQ